MTADSIQTSPAATALQQGLDVWAFREIFKATFTVITGLLGMSIPLFSLVDLVLQVISSVLMMMVCLHAQ
jgi:hypothetical protein